MCKHGTWTLVEVTIPVDLSHTGKERKEMATIDSCLAPAVRWLNENGFITRASCCGHGEGRPEIVLERVEAN